ncbi:LLM class F420-dependent oxidoreductase, partial [Candidatus Frankia alpina]
ETVVAGTAEVVERALRRYADAGATELIVSLIGDPQEQVRTLDVVAALRSAG